jgi:hypothetical protein
MPRKKKPDNGHWEYHTQLDPENFFGFIYRIDNTVNGKSYIGKKQFYSYRRKKKVKEMKWRTYTSSSKYLNADIKLHGKKKFNFITLCQCISRAALTYTEANFQHRLHVLTAHLEDSEDRLFYNGQISGIKFIPPSKGTDIDVMELKL